MSTLAGDIGYAVSRDEAPRGHEGALGGRRIVCPLNGTARLTDRLTTRIPITDTRHSRVDVTDLVLVRMQHVT
jgi:hypothetical protein